MDLRDVGLDEMYERVKADRLSLGLVSFRRIPTTPSDLGDLPCVFMLEGIDRIIQKSNRNTLGYPAKRLMEVPFEVFVNKKGSISVKTLTKSLRRTIFKIRDSNPPEYSGVIGDNVFISENRTEGPMSYGLPDIEGMRLVIDLTYIDGGL